MIKVIKENKQMLLYMMLAFTFSVAMRLIWLYQFDGYEDFIYNSQFMINTNDGYYFAEGARDILAGFHQPNDLSPIEHAASITTAFFAKILPFSFETIILFLPAVLSSLIVIPIILLAKELKNIEVGFIAALVGSVTWSYYNRTMIGYFDTDMLNIVLPMFVLWSIVGAIKSHKENYLLLVGFFVVLYKWWYPVSYTLGLSFFALILLYTLVFERKKLFNYKLLTILMLAMVMVDPFFNLFLVASAFFVLKQEKFEKYTYHLLGASLLVFLAMGGLELLYSKLKYYIFKDSVSNTSEGLKLHFFTVTQTIREASQIPFETFANRISGSVITFSIAIFAYVFMVFKERVMIFALPMIGLGFLASVGGLRFTVYAVPIFALAVAYLVVFLASKIPNKKVSIAFMVVSTLAILYPNYEHIQGYKVPTVFSKDEVKVLDKLHTISQREDYVVSWWDYGYPIKYYSDLKTLIDGGKHTPSAMFSVSYMMTHSQEVAAKLARLEVEYTEKGFKDLTKASNIEKIAQDYELNDTNDLLDLLKTDVKLPKKTRDIYFYLPFRMLDIYPTIAMFSNIDLMDGKKKKSPFFYVTHRFRDKGALLDLGRGMVLNKQTQTLQIGKNKVPIRRFIKTYYTPKKELKVIERLYNFSSNLSVIYMSNYNTFVVVDERAYNSLYVQLMVLQKYDSEFFKPVIMTPKAKVYKLKI